MKNEEAAQIINRFDIESFQNDLIDWFEKEQRILPWRESKDPYKVWVSEIMLQQTKVDTVIPYFNHFMKQFPKLQDLAEADEQDVLKAWEGLGYYSRARNLQNAVKEVVTSYGGKIPENEQELSSLKGVGPYTKGAILSIAYGVPSPAVDGNVMRVLSRLLKVEEDISKQRVRKIFEECIKEIISEDNPSAFNQGLMELGALVCTPKNPACMLCPVQKHCRAFHLGIEGQLPIKTKNKKQKRIPYYVCLVQDEQNRYLVQQRPDQGLLANLWEFPMVSLEEVNPNKMLPWFERAYGLRLDIDDPIDQVKHVFSHVIWELQVAKGRVVTGSLDNPRALFVTREEMGKLPFPVSHQKIMKHL